MSFINSGAEKPLILLAEDNPANAMLITDYLQMAGYRVAVARDGVEALAAAGKLKPALILMDVQMPNMDGLEAVSRFKQNPLLKEIPVIMLTALAMDGDKERCLGTGADDYLSKPIKMKKLLQYVSRWTDTEAKKNQVDPVASNAYSLASGND